MDKNNRSSFSNRSVDDLLDQQLNGMRYQNMEVPDYSNDPLYMQSPGNLFYPDQFQTAEARNTLPFVFNTREDVVPAMVGMGGGNYMVFGTSAEKSMNVPNVHYANKTNGTLSGISSFQADYNLFAGGINSVTPSFTSQSESSTSTTPQLIENLVGHWASDQSGTYSPFGSCMPGTQGQSTSVLDRATKKTRIVAEVRPMRPSYSDVLSKSVPNQPKIGKPTDGKLREVKDVNNGKSIKSSIGRSLSGNNNANARHILSGDDPTRSGSNSSLKTAGMKKSTDTEPEEPMTKKWVSLDDLTGGISENNFMDDVKTKKSSVKHTPAKKVKDGWETIQLSNGKSPTGKVPTAKKASPVATAKPNVGVKERETTPGLKFEQTKNRVSPEERRVPVATQPKSADSSKATRRNSRGLQAERAKRNARGRRRETENWWTAVFAQRADILVAYVLWAARWLVSLVLDVFALSTNLGVYMFTVCWSSSLNSLSENYTGACNWLKGISLAQWLTSSRFWPFKRTEKTSSSSDSDSDSDSGEADGKKKRKRLPGGLKHNLPLPSTGEEAMKRLLACKGKDPYSILGVSQDCTDDDIKRYYKRQAFLVHPDKNSQPGAEEAFKILVHAFDIIGEPEHRKTYDRSVEKSAQAAQAWSELSELLAQLHKKMEYVANTIRCTNCGKRHKRTVVNRPIYAARMCAQCKICHSAREGDIWAETTMFGMMWRYFACMDGGLYDISEWAACQGNNLKNLKANTHQVQYRIVLGKQAHKNNRSQPTASPGGEPDLEEFINNLYSKPESAASSDIGTEGGVRSRKHKRKK